MTAPTVLILTHRHDHYTVDRVADALRERGARPQRVDTDRFPAEARLSSAPGEGDVMVYGDVTIPSGAVEAVWMRHLGLPPLSEELDPAFRVGSQRESVAALYGFLDGLHHARWIDPPDAVHAAENKLRQLRLARGAGLAVPRTLVSNDPARVRAFYDAERGGGVVAKMLTPLSTGMEGARFFVHTQAVTDAHLEDLDGLQYSPMVFQSRVPKARELRVAYVAGRCFVGAIDTSQVEGAEVDWRRAAPGATPWRHDTLPDAVVDALRRLMTSLGLRFGAIDLIVTPDGGHVFLEVNPCGEWGMLERDLELPIAAAIADALLHPEAMPCP